MPPYAIQFLTDVVKPWDQLNQLLSRPYAYQPDFSDVTRTGNAIAVALKHTAELTGNKRSEIDRASLANKVMSDRADAWKHGDNKLEQKSRWNSMTVLSRFEFNDQGKFRFLRNRLVIKHATLGELDFMEHARGAATFWIQRLNLQVQWENKILIGPNSFEDAALIYYDASQQIGMPSWRLETVKRNPQGRVENADCPQIFAGVMDYSDDRFQSLGPSLPTDE